MSDEYYGKNLFGDQVNVGLLEESESVEEPAKNSWNTGFNIYALTDAMGERDKKKAWTIYQKALASGMSAEEVYFRGVIWWMKSMLITAKTSSASESDINPNVYRKSKTFLKNWKTEELEQLSEDLVVGYHQARRGIGELETMIEKVLLNL